MHDYRPTPFEGSVPGSEIQADHTRQSPVDDFSAGHDRAGFGQFCFS